MEEIEIGQRLFDLIEAIAADSGKNNKVAMLTAASNDVELGPWLQKMLEYTYSNAYTFGIKYVEPKTGHGQLDLTFDQVWVLLDQLSSRGLTGNAARDGVQQVMAFLEPKSAELFRRIIHKDMRAGFSGSTINKVWPGLIPDVPYMRCGLPKDGKIDKWDWEGGIYAQLKADGMFQRAIVDDGEVTFVSRSGEYMPPEALADLKDAIGSAVSDYGLKHAELDGELVVYDATNQLLDRATGNGEINSIRQGGIPTPGWRVVYSAWDIRGDEDYDGRMQNLATILQFCTSPLFVLNPSTIVYSIGDAFQKCRDYMKERLEGAIIKKRTGLWKDGTSRDQVKLKIAFQVEVEFTHFIEGSKGKKTAKTFGAIAYKSKCGKLTGSCSGFSDKERADINADRDAWIGAIGTVEANDITKGRDAEVWALSHPRFIERRDDKTEADTLERMQEILEGTRLKFEQGDAA